MTVRDTSQTTHSTLGEGLRMAFSTLTIAPIAVRRIDRQVGGVAMALAPAVGAALGLVLGGVGVLATTLGAGVFLAAALMVALDAVLTRAMHLDGLADTADALGSYRDRETALSIMKKSDIGPFGVASICLVLLLQVATLTTILPRSPLAVVGSLAAAAATGRLAVTFACRVGVPAARPSGLGALTAGTVTRPIVAIATVGVAVVSVAAVPWRWWQGPLPVLVALVLSVLFIRHVVRRIGGVTGDVLGCTVMITTTATLVGLSLGG